MKNVLISKNILIKKENSQKGRAQMNDNMKKKYLLIKKNKINNRLNNNKMIVLLVFYAIIIFIIPSQEKRSYITLKIFGIGNQSVYFGNNTWDNCLDQPSLIPPDEVRINKIKQKDVNYQYYFDEFENNVELIWYENTNITSSACLFYTCENITEIDLSNFDSSQVTNTYRMFAACINLISLNLSNFNTANVNNAEAMFRNCSLLTKIDVSSFDTSKMTSIFRMFFSCPSLTSLDLSNFLTPNVARMEEMFRYCDKLKYINFKNAIFGENLGYAGAFFAAKNLVCCVNDERLIEMVNNYECAMVNCSDNWNDNQKKIIIENDSCIDHCALSKYKFEYNSFCYSNCPNGTVPNKNNICYFLKLSEEVKDKDELVQNIQDFMDSGINLDDLDNGSDVEIKEEGITIAITTTDNQKNSENNKNKTVIDLKGCEDKLKEKYNISKNNSLYILKIDVEQKGMKIPKIEYEVYYPLFGNELIKLNLSYCKDVNIDLLIPTVINGNIDKYNSKSDYYNDICSKTSSDSKIDIPLRDRKNEFLENNLTLCEDNCDFVDYDNENKKVKCSCEIKINLPIINEVTIDKEKLKNSFTDINNILNIKIMKCQKTVFIKESLKSNYGCFIILFILLLYLICLFSFYCKYYQSLKNIIYSIESAKINIIKFNNKKNENNLNTEQKGRKSSLNKKINKSVNSLNL